MKNGSWFSEQDDGSHAEEGRGSQNKHENYFSCD